MPYSILGRRYDINTQLVLGARSCGVGRSGAKKLCSIMNLAAPVSQHPWQDITKRIEDASIDLRDESCAKARVEAAALSRNTDSTRVNADGSVNVPTGFDGSWQQRGWTSSQGIVAALAQDTGKVLDVHHMVNACVQCSIIESSREKKEIDQLQYLRKVVAHAEDDCRRNYEGSPQSMEAAGKFAILLRNKRQNRSDSLSRIVAKLIHVISIVVHSLDVNDFHPRYFTFLFSVLRETVDANQWGKF